MKEPEAMKHILLVEDDYDIIKLLKLHFHPDEFRLTSCNKGSAALEKIKQGIH